MTEKPASSYSDGIVTSIASTYAGAKKIMDPEFLQRFLLPGVPLPSDGSGAAFNGVRAGSCSGAIRGRSFDGVACSSERTRAGGDHDPVSRWGPPRITPSTTTRTPG